LYQMELPSWLVPFHLGLSPWNPYWCLLDHFVWFFLCAVVLFGAGSGGRTLHHPGWSWKVVEVLPCTKWNFLMVGQPFHLGLESWNHVGVVGSLCVVFCLQWCCCLGLDQVVGPLHTWNGWGLFYQMELSSWFGPPFPLGSAVPGTMLVPVGSLCVVFCAVVLFGAGSGE
jgi:hypothetical protein